MAVGANEAVAGKVLAAVVHSGLQQAVHDAARQHRDDARIAVEGAVADHAAAAVVEVEHRREAQVDAAGAQLGGEHVAGRPRRFERAHGAGAGTAVAVVHPHLAEDAHRRQRREAVAAEALDAAALVVDADEQVGADRLHLGDQLGQLEAVAPVAREQDDPAGERMGETAAIVGVEGEAGDVEDDRRVGEVHRADSCSTTTKLAA